ncbi:DUF84 family protein [Escherichia coli]
MLFSVYCCNVNFLSNADYAPSCLCDHHPAKIQAILQAFHESSAKDPAILHPLPSERCTEQPFGSEETRAGARNRVANAGRLLPERPIFGWRLKLASMVTALSVGW